MTPIPEKCCCDLFQEPSYNVRQNPHSVKTRWDCQVHGVKENFWLIHKEPQEGCIPCHTTQEEDMAELKKLSFWDNLLESEKATLTFLIRTTRQQAVRDARKQWEHDFAEKIQKAIVDTKDMEALTARMFQIIIQALTSTE